MKCAIYMRVSTEEQRERQSIETQRAFALRYCETNSIAVYAFYADDAVSGTVPLEQRPEGGRLIADAREAKFQQVLVYKLDRLGRDPLVTLLAARDLRAAGVQVRSMTESFDADDPVGEFTMTLLSGFAGLERKTIIARSIEGTNRLARVGAWLGGVVPFGYRAVGKGKDSRLEVSREPIAGLGISEADVIRMIFQMAVERNASCPQISHYLNQIGVPPAYIRDGRKLLRGKRKQVTSGIWRPSRVRNLIVATVYKGVHVYGKRSARKRELIERAVPAIVDEGIWARAQEVLRKNFLFSPRNGKRQYLLRGMVKCGLCGLTYIGTTSPNAKIGVKTYYVCNGKHQARGLYGLNGKRCPSKAISGDIENIVWRDIEGFLRNPGEVLNHLGARLSESGNSSMKSDVVRLQKRLTAKAGERDAVLGLFRKGRIDESTLDRQLDEIAAEEAEIQEQVRAAAAACNAAATTDAHLRSAEALLLELNSRLDGPLTWDLKRQLVEDLVQEVRVETAERIGKKEASVIVAYRFDPIVNRRDTDS